MFTGARIRDQIRQWRRRGRPKVAIDLAPRNIPWGGGNQFVELLDKRLARNGYHPVYELQDGVAAILIIGVRAAGSDAFGINAIRAFKEQNPGVPCIHRINECDKRKGTDGVDETLRHVNDVADFTVFVSHWLRDYFSERWFDHASPHAVIENGADPDIFFPTRRSSDKPDRLRLVTHHWSRNWMKGFEEYREIDRLIADGALQGVSLTVIGRWPEEIKWRSARLLGPTRGRRLARLLRAHDAYVTASRWEPFGMHYVEGVMCGLPLVYHRDGGGTSEFGERYGVVFDDDPAEAIRQVHAEYETLRPRILSDPPSGDRMFERYLTVMETAMANSSRN